MAYFVYQQVDRGCQEEVHELSQKVKPFGQEEYQRRKRLIQPGRERVPAFQRPPKIARTFLSLFFEHHEGLARWHAKAWDEIECTEVAEGRTILGRRRLIDPEASNWNCFQSKTNLVVEGACADGIKLALCEIRKRLPGSTWIIAIVQDEIIVETPEAEAEQVKKLLEEIMVSVFDKLFKNKYQSK